MNSAPPTQLLCVFLLLVFLTLAEQQSGFMVTPPRLWKVESPIPSAELGTGGVGYQNAHFTKSNFVTAYSSKWSKKVVARSQTDAKQILWDRADLHCEQLWCLACEEENKNQTFAGAVPDDSIMYCLNDLSTDFGLHKSIVAINAATGNTVWTSANHTVISLQRFVPSKNTMIIATSSGLVSMHVSNGTVAWQYDVSALSDEYPMAFMNALNMYVFAEANVVVTAAVFGVGIIANDLDTGALKWTSSVNDTIAFSTVYSTALDSPKATELFVTVNNQQTFNLLYSVNAKTGSVALFMNNTRTIGRVLVYGSENVDVADTIAVMHFKSPYYYNSQNVGILTLFDMQGKELCNMSAPSDDAYDQFSAQATSMHTIVANRQLPVNHHQLVIMNTGENNDDTSPYMIHIQSRATCQHKLSNFRQLSDAPYFESVQRLNFLQAPPKTFVSKNDQGALETFTFMSMTGCSALFNSSAALIWEYCHSVNTKTINVVNSHANSGTLYSVDYDGIASAHMIFTSALRRQYTISQVNYATTVTDGVVATYDDTGAHNKIRLVDAVSGDQLWESRIPVPQNLAAELVMGSKTVFVPLETVVVTFDRTTGEYLGAVLLKEFCGSPVQNIELSVAGIVADAQDNAYFTVGTKCLYKLEAGTTNSVAVNLASQPSSMKPVLNEAGTIVFTVGWKAECSTWGGPDCIPVLFAVDTAKNTLLWEAPLPAAGTDTYINIESSTVPIVNVKGDVVFVMAYGYVVAAFYVPTGSMMWFDENTPVPPQGQYNRPPAYNIHPLSDGKHLMAVTPTTLVIFNTEPEASQRVASSFDLTKFGTSAVSTVMINPSATPSAIVGFTDSIVRFDNIGSSTLKLEVRWSAKNANTGFTQHHVISEGYVYSRIGSNTIFARDLETGDVWCAMNEDSQYVGDSALFATKGTLIVPVSVNNYHMWLLRMPFQPKPVPPTFPPVTAAPPFTLPPGFEPATIPPTPSPSYAPPKLTPSNYIQPILPYSNDGCLPFAADPNVNCVSHFYADTMTSLTIVVQRYRTAANAKVYFTDIAEKRTTLSANFTVQRSTTYLSIVIIQGSEDSFVITDMNTYQISGKTGMFVHNGPQVNSICVAEQTKVSSNGNFIVCSTFGGSVHVHPINTFNNTIYPWEVSVTTAFNVSNVNRFLVDFNSDANLLLLFTIPYAWDETPPKNIIHAFNLSSGQELWYIPADSDIINMGNNNNPPVVADWQNKRIFYQMLRMQSNGDNLPLLWCVDLLRGKTLFNNTFTGMEPYSDEIRNGLTISPDGTMIYATYYTTLIAYDALNGDVLWSNDLFKSLPPGFTPNLYEVTSVPGIAADGRWYAYLGAEYKWQPKPTVFCVDVSRTAGMVVWTSQTLKLRSGVSAVPLIDGNFLIFPGNQFVEKDTGAFMFQFATVPPHFPPVSMTSPNVVKWGDVLVINSFGAQIIELPVNAHGVGYQFPSYSYILDGSSTRSITKAKTTLFTINGVVAQFDNTDGSVLWTLQLPDIDSGSNTGGMMMSLNMGFTTADNAHYMIMWPQIFKVVSGNAPTIEVTPEIPSIAASVKMNGVGDFSGSYYYNEATKRLFVNDVFTIYMLDENLKVLRKTAPENPIPRTFRMITHNEMLIMVDEGGTVYGYSLENLELLMSARLEDEQFPLLQAVSYGGFVYVTSNYFVFAVEMNKGSAKPTLAWTYGTGDGNIRRIDVYNATLVVSTSVNFLVLSTSLTDMDRTLVNMSGPVWGLGVLESVGLHIVSQADPHQYYNYFSNIRLTAVNTTTGEAAWTKPMDSICYGIVGYRNGIIYADCYSGIKALNVNNGDVEFVPRIGPQVRTQMVFYGDTIVMKGGDGLVTNYADTRELISFVPFPKIQPIAVGPVPPQFPPPAGPLPAGWNPVTLAPAPLPNPPVFELETPGFMEVGRTPSFGDNIHISILFNDGEVGATVHGGSSELQLTVGNIKKNEKLWTANLSTEMYAPSKVSCTHTKTYITCLGSTTDYSNQVAVNVFDANTGAKLIENNDNGYYDNGQWHLSWEASESRLLILTNNDNPILTVWNMKNHSLIKTFFMEDIYSNPNHFVAAEYLPSDDLFVFATHHHYVTVDLKTYNMNMPSSHIWWRINYWDKWHYRGLLGNGTQMLANFVGYAEDTGMYNATVAVIDIRTNEILHATNYSKENSDSGLTTQPVKDQSTYAVYLLNYSSTAVQLIGGNMTVEWSGMLSPHGVSMTSQGTSQNGNQIVYNQVIFTSNTNSYTSLFVMDVYGQLRFHCNTLTIPYGYMYFPIGTNFSSDILYIANSMGPSSSFKAVAFSQVQQKVIADSENSLSASDGVIVTPIGAKDLAFVDTNTGDVVVTTPVSETLERVYQIPTTGPYGGSEQIAIRLNPGSPDPLGGVTIITKKSISSVVFDTDTSSANALWSVSPPKEATFSNFMFTLPGYLMIVGSVNTNYGFPYDPRSNNDHIFVFDLALGNLLPIVDFQRTCALADPRFATVSPSAVSQFAVDIDSSGASSTAYFTAGTNCLYRVRQAKKAQVKYAESATLFPFEVDAVPLHRLTSRTPVLSRNLIIAADSLGKVYAVDKTTFNITWVSSLGYSPYGFSQLKVVSFGSDDQQYVLATSQNFLTCLNAETGATMWVANLGDSVDADTDAIQLHDNEYLVVLASSTLMCAKPSATGVNMVWKLKGYGSGNNVAFAIQQKGMDVAPQDNLLLVGAGKEGGVQALDVTTGNVKWSADHQCASAVTLEEPINSTSTTLHTVAFFTCSSIMIGFDINDGRVMQTFGADGQANTFFAVDKTIVAENNGNLRFYSPAPVVNPYTPAPTPVPTPAPSSDHHHDTTHTPAGAATNDDDKNKKKVPVAIIAAAIAVPIVCVAVGYLVFRNRRNIFNRNSGSTNADQEAVGGEGTHYTAI